MAIRGESQTFEGETIDFSVRGGLNFLKEQLPIAPGEVAQGIAEGRPEAALELLGVSSVPNRGTLLLNEASLERGWGRYEDLEPFQKRLLRFEYKDEVDWVNHGDDRSRYYRRLDEVEKERLVKEQEAVSKFTSHSINKRRFLDEYFAVDDWARVSREEAARSLRQTYEEVPENEQDANERALNEWYAVLEDDEVSQVIGVRSDGTEIRGLIDWDVFERKRELLMRKFRKEGTSEYVLRNTNDRVHTEDTLKALGRAGAAKTVANIRGSDAARKRFGVNPVGFLPTNGTQPAPTPLQTEPQRQRQLVPFGR